MSSALWPPQPSIANGETSLGTVSSGSATINFASTNAVSLTVGANTTFTVTGGQTGGCYILRIIQDGTGSWTYAWSSNVKFPSDVTPLPSGANKIDMVFLYFNGTNYDCTFSGNYSG